MPGNGPRKRKWLIFAALALLLVLGILLVEIDLLVRLLWAINWPVLLAGTIVLLGGYLLLTVRLRYILRNQPGWWEIFFANSIGYMLHIALFAPAMIARIVSVGTVTSVSIPQASSAILVERLPEQVMRISATILAVLLLVSEQTNPDISIGGGVILLLVLFGAIFWVMHHRDQVVNRLAATKFKPQQLIQEISNYSKKQQTAAG